MRGSTDMVSRMETGTHKREPIGLNRLKSRDQKVKDLKQSLEHKYQKLSKLPIWPKIAKFDQIGSIFDDQRNFLALEYDFLKENHKNNFHTKNWEDL